MNKEIVKAKAEALKTVYNRIIKDLDKDIDDLFKECEDSGGHEQVVWHHKNGSVLIQCKWCSKKLPCKHEKTSLYFMGGSEYDECCNICGKSL